MQQVKALLKKLERPYWMLPDPRTHIQNLGNNLPAVNLCWVLGGCQTLTDQFFKDHLQDYYMCQTICRIEIDRHPVGEAVMALTPEQFYGYITEHMDVFGKFLPPLRWKEAFSNAFVSSSGASEAAV